MKTFFENHANILIMLIMVLTIFACEEKGNKADSGIPIDCKLYGQEFTSETDTEKRDNVELKFSTFETIGYKDVNGKTWKIILEKVDGDYNGDFHRIRIVDNTSVSFFNADGWIKPKHGDSYQVQDFATNNEIKSDYVILKKNNDDFLLFAFGYGYASEPGLLSIINLSLKKPQLIFNDNYELVSYKENDPNMRVTVYGQGGDPPGLIYTTDFVLKDHCMYKAEPPKTTERYLFEHNFAENNVFSVFNDYDFAPSEIYMPNIGFSAGKRVIYNGSVKLLELGIPETALAVLDKKELRILRNAIFAKHGMIFQSEDLKAHFKQFDWYKPQSSDVNNKLTNVDKANIESIQAFENAKPKPNLSKKNLVSSYSLIPDVVPSWCPELRINDDNKIEYYGWHGEDNFKGNYIIENGFLVVLVMEQRVGTSEYLINKSWHWPESVTYSDGIAIYKNPIKLVFPVGDALSFDEYDIHKKGWQIGSIKWWEAK